MKILHVVGARPNFMKIAPIMREMSKFPENFRQVLVHTGQHYDENMSRVFFEDLDLPRPDLNLDVGSGTHAWQTAQIMLAFEPVVQDLMPDWVVVVGDVNSTIACALVCSKLSIPVAHIEAGLRSYDRAMPEEINRVLTDQLSMLLFTHSPEALENLTREGIDPARVHFVGNVMIDTLVRLLPDASARWPEVHRRSGLDESGEQRFVLVTLHRPSNVDDPVVLAEILHALEDLSRSIQVIFPVHPRTRKVIDDLAPSLESGRLRLLEPLGYLDFIALESRAALVLTDSGGVQEETTFLGVPCLTVRPNTERPITVTQGTNELVESSRAALVGAANRRLTQRAAAAPTPERWDGGAAERIVQTFLSLS